MGRDVETKKGGGPVRPSRSPCERSVTDLLELIGLIVALVALLIGIFPIRAYLVERYWPFKVRMTDAPRRGFTSSQYRIYVMVENRTASSVHFGLGFTNAELGPSPNYPSWTITRTLTGEVINRGDLPIGPHEREAWIVFLDFPRPLARPVTFRIFSRLPEGGVFPLGHLKPWKFEYELQPIT
jgi:hypothetical protein